MSLQIVLLLLTISFLLALRAFNNLKKNKEIHEVKKILRRGKVIYHKDSKEA